MVYQPGANNPFAIPGKRGEMPTFVVRASKPQLPPVDLILESALVVALPMRTRFRGITVREAMLFRGLKGWGEFAPFPEYDDVESATWLAAGIEAAWQGPPPAVRDTVEVNATVPAVPAEQVAAVLERFPGARTAKVKVAEAGQSLHDDVERVAAVRELVPTVRIDANGAWDVPTAIEAIAAIGDVEYVEQPCATVKELAAVRRVVNVPIAADESIRRAEDPLLVAKADAADIAVLKVAPLGGMRKVLALRSGLNMDVVISSALDTAVGMSAGIAAAAALPMLNHACGLGTGALFERDVAPSFIPRKGMVTPRLLQPDDDLPLASPERTAWWHERLRRCHAILMTR
ncbi:o-succinylbenzoate synthase [Gordonia hirsuta DSM 44140 = NBRC 16056]|uniref:o-succinylbenzoate synthase n=1 Tax=Gordonia hirsuta DSM 44140 = NBRC 16056 TaxID=1121927 RepID=L7L5U9_9ACTN|nr:o-succinylbenzoate synthase [Gordonia hirsuta DSM 44140 = NBRC 16056]